MDDPDQKWVKPIIADFSFIVGHLRRKIIYQNGAWKWIYLINNKEKNHQRKNRLYF